MVPERLLDLESAQRAAEAHSIVPPTMSIREMTRRFPATRSVLERYGLGDCGGDDGPDEPLAWFATVHRLPLDDFLRDVRAAAVRDVAAAAPPPAASAPAASPFSPHFIIGSLFLTLTLGATTGMINLLRIAAGGDVPIDHRQIHGHTQILGFATLFLMGIAYHALPRILGVGARGMADKRAVGASFWLMFGGVVLRNAGQPIGLHAAGRLLSLASAAMELASAVLFIRFVFGLIRAVREGRRPADPRRVLCAGTVYLAPPSRSSARRDSGSPQPRLGPARLAEPALLFRRPLRVPPRLDLRLRPPHRGALSRSRSFKPRLGPGRPGDASRGGRARRDFVAAGPPNGAALALRDAGLGLAALSAVVYLAGNGFLWRRSEFPMLRTPGNPTFAIRAAFGCLGLWAVLELSAVVLSRLTPLPAQNLWWADAARHVFTIGFLTLLIVGMAFRILPVFSGKTLWSPRLAHVTYALLLLGAAMRLLQYPAAFLPVFYELGSYMGIPVVLGLVLFVFNLVRTMRGRPSPAPGAGRTRPAASFASTLPVR